MGVDYIKIAATARHIQETVLHRAAENEIKLSARMLATILKASSELAFIAHLGERQ